MPEACRSLAEPLWSYDPANTFHYHTTIILYGSLPYPTSPGPWLPQVASGLEVTVSIWEPFKHRPDFQSLIISFVQQCLLDVELILSSFGMMVRLIVASHFRSYSSLMLGGLRPPQNLQFGALACTPWCRSIVRDSANHIKHTPTKFQRGFRHCTEII
mgnify:CR=1 FL=1